MTDRRLTEAEHRARRATALVVVLDLASQKLGTHPYHGAAAIAGMVRLTIHDRGFWAILAEKARIGKPPSEKTIEAVAEVYEQRARFLAGRKTVR